MKPLIFRQPLLKTLILKYQWLESGIQHFLLYSPMFFVCVSTMKDYDIHSPHHGAPQNLEDHHPSQLVNDNVGPLPSGLEFMAGRG